jgi:hypothetical protein
MLPPRSPGGRDRMCLPIDAANHEPLQTLFLSLPLGKRRAAPSPHGDMARKDPFCRGPVTAGHRSHKSCNHSRDCRQNRPECDTPGRPRFLHWPSSIRTVPHALATCRNSLAARRHRHAIEPVSHRLHRIHTRWRGSTSSHCTHRMTSSMRSMALGSGVVWTHRLLPGG